MHNFFRTLVPEQFDARITINGDGSYAYSYDGVLIFVPALIQGSRAPLDSRMEAQLREGAAQLRHEGFQRADYIDCGRYSVFLERTAARGESSFFPSREMKLFSIRPQLDGAILIGAFRPDATTPCQLTGTDAKIDGALHVTLASGVDVISHNAQREVFARGVAYGYYWRIRSPDADPFIIVRPTFSNSASPSAP